ncbi:hypothetical protein [Andreprevotia chitinilytica]|uniref:hypothetical protein n=1 Tax=Andreprevotia chitinilytica TaxID=396808 RepID=UPI00068D33C5|nr:hypothetical protein [Andreprevotia chitinilytica]
MAEEALRQAAPSCRLSIKLASQAPVAVLLRREPTGWAQMIKWNTANDTFECGQWFRGRIYADMSDLSDDGELLLYVARKGGARTLAEVGSDTWTALSRPPFFTALALWPHDGLCGGGIFTGHREVQLDIPATKLQAHADHLPRGVSVQTHDGPHGVWMAAQKALRSDWQCIASEDEHDPLGDFSHPKTVGNGAIRLLSHARSEKQPRRAARTVESFVVSNVHGDTEIGAADFADFDQRQRLVFSRNGQLFVCDQPSAATLEWRMLADFSEMRPQRVEPSNWARDWPSS